MTLPEMKCPGKYNRFGLSKRIMNFCSFRAIFPPFPSCVSFFLLRLAWLHFLLPRRRSWEHRLRSRIFIFYLCIIFRFGVMASLQSTQVNLRNKQRWEMMGFRQEPWYTQTRSRSVKVNHAKGVKTRCQPGSADGCALMFSFSTSRFICFFHARKYIIVHKMFFFFDIWVTFMLF